MDKKKIAIVGAGLSGLIVAKKLSKHQFDITVFEKETKPGGRMKTDRVGNWELDRGFQVMLTEYPYLKKNVDFSSLKLVKLESGASIVKNDKIYNIGDPTRNFKFLIPTLFSPIGSFRDKFLIFKLSLFVKRKSIDELFCLKNETTDTFLKDYGFSSNIVENFFRPFYTGIFLEDQLRTSSRMFLFVFKMFAEGNAVIPTGGIGELCAHLADELEDVNIMYDTSISEIDEGSLSYNTKQESFDIIINTNPTFDTSFRQGWKGSYTFYFEHKASPIINTPRIGLIASKDKLINNIFYASHTQQTEKNNKLHLLSVTVVNDQGLSIEDLKRRVTKECQELVKERIKYVHHYVIPNSLPDIEAPVNNSNIDLDQSVIHIGDFILNGSQNAACKVAEEVAEQLNLKHSRS